MHSCQKTNTYTYLSVPIFLSLKMAMLAHKESFQKCQIFYTPSGTPWMKKMVKKFQNGSKLTVSL